MFAKRFFGARYYGPRYFSGVGADPVIGGGGYSGYLLTNKIYIYAE